MLRHDDVNIPANALPMLHPASVIISGPSSVGKTRLVRELLCDDEFSIWPPPQRIVFIYSVWQPAYDEIKVGCLQLRGIQIEWMDSLEKLSSVQFSPDINNLVICDDQQEYIKDSEEAASFFLVKCHHLNATIIVIQQCLFPKGKKSKQVHFSSFFTH